jgi:hypothetical protein
MKRGVGKEHALQTGKTLQQKPSHNAALSSYFLLSSLSLFKAVCAGPEGEAWCIPYVSCHSALGLMKGDGGKECAPRTRKSLQQDMFHGAYV